MYRKFKLSLLMMTVFVAGCETYNLERPRESLAAQKQTDLINRSEVIAVVNSADVAADLEQQAARWGYDLIRKEVLAGLDLYLLAFDCPPSIDPHVASVELERLQPLSTVEANHKYVLQSAMSDVPLLNSISPRKYANSLIEWPAEGCEALYNIGIIDGGVDTSSLVVSNSAAIESRAFISGKKAIEAQRHGTAIAEILVGNGRLKNAKLFNASVVSEDNDGVQFSGVEPMLKALDWMVSSDVRVVNISLAGPYNRTLDRGIQRAADKGIIIVAAVGNDGAQSSPLYPAALKDVIAATAVDSNADIYNKAVHGRHVDVSAPGVEVFVGDPNTGRYVSGTSIAAPFVAAKIASDPRYGHAKSTSDVKNILSQGAIDLGVAGPDDVFGVGLMQADKGCHQ
jgi:hypothetical protein